VPKGCPVSIRSWQGFIILAAPARKPRCVKRTGSGVDLRSVLPKGARKGVFEDTYESDEAHGRERAEILDFSQSSERGGFVKPYRDVAVVAGAQIACFLLLTNLEPNFSLIHLYQSILYIAILVLLFYMEDRWAYMIGMVASVVWLGLAYESGILGSGVHQLSELRTASVTTNLIDIAALMTALLSVLMIAFCGRHWMKEYSRLGKARSTFFVSLARQSGNLDSDGGCMD
jgi:hypothetical protein